MRSLQKLPSSADDLAGQVLAAHVDVPKGARLRALLDFEGTGLANTRCMDELSRRPRKRLIFGRAITPAQTWALDASERYLFLRRRSSLNQ